MESVFSWSVSADGGVRVFRVKRDGEGWECTDILAQLNPDASNMLLVPMLNRLKGEGWAWVEPTSNMLRRPDSTSIPCALTAPEIASVLARLADLWRGSDEAPAVRSVAYYLCKAFRAKSPAFDQEAFWRACRIDPEPGIVREPGFLPDEFHFERDREDPDPPGGVVVTADGEDGGPVVVERIGR